MTDVAGGEVGVRPMREDDADIVAQLAGELGYPTEADAIRARIREIGGSALLLVAVNSADEPLGFIQANKICISEVGTRVEILGLVVSSRARRSGVGRRLIAAAESWAAEIGAEGVILRSNTQRTGAHDFYPAMGYKLIKTQAAYLKKIRAEA